MFTISVFDWKYFFLQMCSKKSKLSVWAEILHEANLNMQNYVENMLCSLFCFRPEKPFLDKSGQKNQTCQFKWKFGTKTNLNMQNPMMVFTFSVFGRKYFFEQIWSKNLQ